MQLQDLGEKVFKDILGTYSTKYNSSQYNRSNNVVLAAQKINGTIVLPGETFSYNQAVGKRTIDAGFKEAGAYAGGKVIQEVGGGICQISSTLYNAVLYANLEIVSRTGHYFETGYVDASRDATVSWGTLDFKFKNNRTYPILIEAYASGGTASVTIKGLKEEGDFEVQITSQRTSYINQTINYIDDEEMYEGEERIEQEGHGGATSVGYKILYKDGAEVERILLSRDTYHPLERIIRRGTKKVEIIEEPQTLNNEEQNTVEENTNTVTNTTTNTENSNEVI